MPGSEDSARRRGHRSTKSKTNSARNMNSEAAPAAAAESGTSAHLSAAAADELARQREENIRRSKEGRERKARLALEAAENARAALQPPPPPPPPPRDGQRAETSKRMQKSRNAPAESRKSEVEVPPPPPSHVAVASHRPRATVATEPLVEESYSDLSVAAAAFVPSRPAPFDPAPPLVRRGGKSGDSPAAGVSIVSRAAPEKKEQKKVAICSHGRELSRCLSCGGSGI